MRKKAEAKVSPPKLAYFVAGIPAPKGSMRGFRHKNRVVLTNANPKTKVWQTQVTKELTAAWAGQNPIDSFVRVELAFYLPRPKSVKRIWPCVKPDLDKLIRTILDALTKSGVLQDDALVVQLTASKRYVCTVNPSPGVNIYVRGFAPNVAPYPGLSLG